MIIAEPSLHLNEVPRTGEIRSQDIDFDTGFPAEPIRQRLHSHPISRHENEIVAALGETVGVDRANPAGGSRNQYRWLIRHCLSPFNLDSFAESRFSNSASERALRAPCVNCWCSRI